MRRVIYLALTLLVAASAAAFIGRQPAAAQPTAIQIAATSPTTFQVSVNFNTDESPVTFSAANPVSGPAATVTSLSLLSCTHLYLGNCTAAVGDTDASPVAYNSGAGLANLDLTSGHEPVTFVVAVTTSCSTPSTVFIVAAQSGVVLSAPLVCGAPAASLYYPGQLGYFLPFYAFVGEVMNQGLYIDEPVALYPGTPFIANRPRYLGAGFGAVVFGASGTEKNLARHALQQVVNQLPAYLAAYGADPALAPIISQQIVAYANAFWSNPPSIQEIIRQIPAMIAAYAIGGGSTFVPPRTGEAGYLELYPDAEYPMVTFVGVVPANESLEPEAEFIE